MSKPTLYVETSVVSYLTARPSNDLIVAAHQKATQDWWAQRSDQFDLKASEFVTEEASDGHPEASQKRIAALAGITSLEINSEIEKVAAALLNSNAVPKKERLDALHIAVASVHRIDYLLTWNFRHIANAQKWAAIEIVCVNFGYRMPKICSPFELMQAE
jgi:hypothetical protein